MNNIKVDKEKLRKGMACFDTTDLLDTMKKYINYLECHNENYTNEQYHKIQTLQFVMSCLREEEVAV